MAQEQRHSTPETVGKKPVRPVLIVSEHTVLVYPMLLERLLVGLADESIPTALVYQGETEVASIVPPSVQVIKQPDINLPLIRRRHIKVLLEQLADFKPTVLHCLCASEATLTKQLAHRLEVPYMVTVNSLQKGWRQLSISARDCAQIIVPTKSIGAKLTNLYPRFAERTRQVNIGTFVQEENVCFRAPGCLACMVTAHPLDKVGDFEKLLSAVKHLVIDGYELLLVLIGSGRAERPLRKLLRALGLLWIVTIVPRLAHWRPVLAAGDIFIRPQPTDAFDPLMLEAMSVGAAVAGCKGGVDDLIIEGQTGVLFDPDDELSIYSCLQRLLDSREFAQQLATGAQRYLRENHSVSSMISSMVQTYRNAELWYRR